ncbi:MAG: 5-dehydro-4-deoxyglucarate dehydratase [Gaiellales bacterium]|jgi:4-hydroxy-tetrahydrodipicolinate synthase|nr:5-dehydro-4-deoxyglucarate dehydratase [Gaiellales bacterium]
MAPERAELHGLWGFVLSPFVEGELDLGALAESAAFQVEAGVDVLCCCGAIAQSDVLDAAEREASLSAALRATGGRVPVALTLPVDADVQDGARAALALGARALLLTPASADPHELAQALGEIAAAAPGLALVLYHRPPLRLEPADLVRLCECAALVGVKDGHRDARLYRRLRGAVPGRLTWIVAYEDLVLPFAAIGAEAFSPVSASYAPAYARAYLRLLAEGDLDGVRALLDAHAYPMTELRFSRPHIDIAVVKRAQRACNLPAGGDRPPQLPLAPLEEDAVTALVHAMRSALAELQGTAA